MAKIKGSISSGDDSISNVGKGNDIRKYVTYNAPRQAIKRSYLYDVSKQILEADIQPSKDFSIKSNAEWDEKFEHNEVSEEYREIISGEAHAYNDIQEIMSTFANSDVLIRKIRNIYLAQEKIRKQKNEDGDFVLINIFNILNDSLKEHEDSLKERMPDEERDRCIWLLMFYTFTKCQLLKNPTEEK